MKHGTLLLALVLLAGCNRQSPEEMMALADEAYKMHDFQMAVQHFAKLVEEHPSTAQAESAAFACATIYHNDLKQPQQAVDAYNKYLSLYPDGKQATLSLFLTGWLYNNELKKLDSAAIAYKAFLEKYPDHEMASSAQFELENLGKPAEDMIPESVAQEPPKPASAPN